jgi:curved DNA-binding protein CbpA
MATNYYSVLGISQNATTEQVRSRFLDLARTLHPDRYQGEEKEKAEARFQEITEAFNILSNPVRRRDHDQELARPQGDDQEGPDQGQLARLYMQRGVKSYREKNFSAAADNFHRAAQAEPTNAKTWYHLALACSQENRWIQQALAAVQRACDLEPMNFRYAKFAGRLFEENGQVVEAEKYYSQALKWGGDDPDIQQALQQLSNKGRKGLSGIFRKN